MTELELQRVRSPQLVELSGNFGRGIHVVLGAASEGTAELIGLAAGTRLPRRGSLTLSGTSPGTSPGLRSRIASLLGNEAASGPRDVRGFCLELGRLKGFDVASSLRRYCPGLPLDRSLGSLSLAEHRQLALAAALGQPDPVLVALHDPLGCVREPTLAAVLERIAELGRQTIVLITTARVADARRLGGNLYVLERGVLARSPVDAWPVAITPGLSADLWIDCDAPRQLLAELLASPEVQRAWFESSPEGHRLRVGGANIERVCEVIARASVSVHAGIRALGVATPDLTWVHGASAGMASAAYKAAQARVLGGEIQPPQMSGSRAIEPTRREPPSGSDVP